MQLSIWLSLSLIYRQHESIDVTCYLPVQDSGACAVCALVSTVPVSEEMLNTILLYSYELAYEYGENFYKFVFRLPVLLVVVTYQ